MKYVFPLLLLNIFFAVAQHQDKVDFIRAEAFVKPIPQEKKIKGSVAYHFQVLQPVDSIFFDAKNIDFSKVLLNKKKVKYINTGKNITIKKRFKKGKTYKISLEYSCAPKQTVYFLGWDDTIPDNEQIWTQGQGKYTSHWLPSFDDMEEKVAFNLNIKTSKNYQVIANGALTNILNTIDSKVWSFNMKKPMSSYLLAFAIGKYHKQKLVSTSGVQIENYYYPKDSLKVEPTYRYTKRIFDFIEKEIGFAYPWQNYKQTPVHDFLYAGMENTSATIFSDGYIIDSTAFVDKNYINVNAHELAHQWFGNLVTEKNGNHHWLHEGFATYYALLAEKEIFGADYFYWKLYESLNQLNELDNRAEGQSLLDPKASSLIFYQKGAWALFMLKEKIGELAFKKGIKSYLKKYPFKNVTVANFFDEMQMATNTDLAIFKKDWIENSDIRFDDAKESLRKASASLNALFTMEEKLLKTTADNFDFMPYWTKTKSIHLKKHLLKSYYSFLPQNILKQALVSDTIPIKQTMAIATDSIPLSLKKDYETLLYDQSYITIENALYKLWKSFPEERIQYLNATKEVQGLPNKNVRLLWLALSLSTNGYDPINTQKYFKELCSYTSVLYSWEIRMRAFQYIKTIGFTDESLTNLIKACVHHSWQFKKYARNLMVELLKDTDYKIRIKKLAKDLKGSELKYMKTKLHI